MKTRLLILSTAFLLLIGFCLPAAAADAVAQGKTVNFDKDKKALIIDEFDTNFGPENRFGKPTGKQLTFNLSNALMGITPVPGDIVRIAYDVKGNENVAVRVMNVSKTDIMRK
jgi:hypothetical protein